VADKDAGKDAAEDRESHPGTAPFVPDFEDTGEHSVPFVPDFSDSQDTGSQPIQEPASSEPKEEPSPPATETAAPVALPGRYQYVKWWKLLLVIFAVWVGAAQVGLSLFYWWYHTIDKTAAVYVVLVYVVACTVGGLMLSMVQGRPLITSLSLGVMSGPFASVAAAAPLYGYYYCERVGHCLVGVIPY
jgi:hypothetical protein